MSPEFFREQLHFFQDLASRLDEHKSCWVHPNIGELAKRKVQHLEARLRIRERDRRPIQAIAREYVAGRYSQYSYGWKSAAQDLFL